jgi:epoxyqueuosine reductase QueG
VKPISNSRHNNTEKVSQLFQGHISRIGERGVFGAASFQDVFSNLMPVQKERLRILCGTSFDDFIENGSIISIGISYRGEVIDCINTTNNHDTDFNLWNHYANEYHRLNGLLNIAARAVAKEVRGIAIPATIEGVATKIKHVSHYYPQTISHRVVAEFAGLGWRGKNGLLINENYSCALRFASILTQMPLLHQNRIESRCGECVACEDACSFIRNRDRLPDYRENCRRYLVYLGKQGLTKDVCGKCIKGCVRLGAFSSSYKLDD